ncbi:unnamed protein product [Cylindrotheca closterium]|uniref:Uncharacterized protein n=1 Tax=Cylindrotheca closterium TaxID=2856 RepID=A0AAD2GAR8_9STRA|nr:unnamed protein product [Cylindrotheca closterium]CAJ1967722.1 unnamed protein product [Cylindrotheca closterium]
MARKKKLRPGKGAIAEILTRFIKPEQPNPGSKHRSMVVLEEEDRDDNQRKIFRFYYDGDEERTLMWANHRYLNVLKEGNHLLLFGGPGEPRPPESKEPNIKWQFSKARRLLVEAVNKGEIVFNEDDEPQQDLKEIYASKPEYSEYLFEKFEERLNNIWIKTKEDKNRASDDLEFFEEFIDCNEVSYFNKDGTAQWQGSEAQEQARVDIAANAVFHFGYRHLFENNTLYHLNYTHEQFKAYVRQEISRKKYLHTVEVRALQKREKENKRQSRK